MHHSIRINPEWKSSSPKWKISTPQWKSTAPQWKSSTPNWKNIQNENKYIQKPQTPTWNSTNQLKNPGWNWVEKKQYSRPEWNEQINSILDSDNIKKALNLTDTFGNHFQSRNGSKIINWMIKNMPDGKQTIIVL